MSVILLVLGIVVAAAGGALIGFGIPISELSRGTTMILAGTSALVGGLILIGLSALVAEMTRVAALLRASQMPRAARLAAETAPAAEAVPREQPVPLTEPQPATSPSLEVSATAIQRLRSSIPRSDKPAAEVEEVPLSPNGQQVHPTEPKVEPPLRAEPMPRPEPMPRGEPVLRLEPAPRSAGAAAVEAREPRLDFLFRPRQAQPAAQPQESFDALWPKRAGREGRPDPRAEASRAPASVTPPPTAEPSAPAAAEAAPDPGPPPSSDEQPAQPERSVAILKSGVVDGMAYTLYADGSIEAQLPQGMVRFGSIAELRAHIESHS